MRFLRPLFFTGLLLLSLSAGLAGGGFLWYFEASTPPRISPGPALAVSIASGSSPKQIGFQLAEAGVIRSPLLFKFLIGFYGISGRLQPGSYSFSGTETPEEVLKVLLQGKEEMVRVTIPEGLTISEIGEILEVAGLSNNASFSGLLNSQSFLAAAFPRWGTITIGEGLAFPETYYFSRGTPTEEIARTMLEFTRITIDNMASGTLPCGLSKYQACILASIVEREAMLDDDRPLVASVFINRLSAKMRLESCSTVQYALPRHKDRLTYEDLKIESAYNTYKVSGLPPSPISNFGKASFAAVAFPPSTDFLYFVSNASGGHRFSKSLGEHEQSRRLFFKERKRMKANPHSN